MKPFALAIVWCAAATLGHAQSSSLYVTDQSQSASYADDPFAPAAPVAPAGEIVVQSTQPSTMSTQMSRVSLAAITVPEPRAYQKHDIVTIIIRESTTASIDASLETEKDVEWDGEIAEFPRLNVADLLNLRLRPNTFPEGNPQLDVSAGSSFEGDGGYEHNTEMTARLAAKIVDVKPNGLLVLEARKFVENDDETMTMVVTGTCSVDDLTIDNTVLSSSLYGLYISKQHSGELRKSTKKGLLTKLMDFVFNF